MESSIDYKNIAGIFPFSQQLLGLYEIGQGLYEIAAIISQAAVSAFKELLGCNLAPKASKDNQWVPLGRVVITDAERANAIGSPVPRFTDEERRNAVSIPEPIPTKKFTSNAFHCNANRPLMTDAEKNNPDTSYSSEPFFGIFPAKSPKNVHDCITVNITEDDIRNANYEQKTFYLDDDEIKHDDEIELEKTVSACEVLKEPITKIAAGILYFLPVIGTFYSINQLLSSCSTESLVKEDREIVSKKSLDN